MKTIRFFAALLLVITGVWHSSLFFKAMNDPDSLPLLIFGILYALIGVMMFTPKVLWVYLGMILPIIGMILAFVKIGMKNFDLTMKSLMLIDLVVIFCCVYVLLTRKKTT
jgi:hypothetical protein